MVVGGLRELPNLDVLSSSSYKIMKTASLGLLEVMVVRPDPPSVGDVSSQGHFLCFLKEQIFGE